MSHTLGAQVSKDLLEKVDEYKEEGESRSAAVRRLIRDGLEEGDRNNRAPLLTATTIAGIAWLGLWFATGPTGSAIVGGATIVGVTLYALWPELEARL
jgi:hypothetical protein